MKVKDCMCHHVWYCKPDTTIGNAAKLMNEKHVGCIPVCNDNNRVVGIITDRDITLRGVACNKDTNTTNVSEIMTTNTTCCDSSQEISTVAEIMGKTGIRRMPVVEQGKLVGILTLGDFARHHQISSECIGTTFEKICQCNDQNAE